MPMTVTRKDYVEIPEIIGLPPKSFVSDNLIHNSIPQLEIIPSIPHVEFGMAAFSLEPAFKEYKKILNLHKYDYKGEESLKVAGAV